MKSPRVVGTYGRKTRLWEGPIPGTHEPGFVELPINEYPVSKAVRRLVHGIKDETIELYAFKMGECQMLLGYEPSGVNGEMRWHLTISCLDRHPTWDEIKTARYRLLGPNMTVAMILPPPQFYVNLPSQNHVMQLWEIDDPARIWETG